MTVPQPKAKVSVTSRIAAWKSAYDAIHEELMGKDVFASMKILGDGSTANHQSIDGARMGQDLNTRAIAAQIAGELVKGVTDGD